MSLSAFLMMHAPYFCDCFSWSRHSAAASAYCTSLRVSMRKVAGESVAKLVKVSDHLLRHSQRSPRTDLSSSLLGSVVPLSATLLSFPHFSASQSRIQLFTPTSRPHNHLSYFCQIAVTAYTYCPAIMAR